MSGQYRLLKGITILLGLITYSTAQAPLSPALVAFDDVCQTQQGITDNLSCPRNDGVLECYPRSQLCDGTSNCADGSDEGVSLNALDCTGQFTGRTTAPIASFVCGAGVVVELDQLCDGVDNCQGGGDDETTALCENKCFFPYYGSCPYSRECIFTDLDLNCGLCRPGWARNPAAILGECLFANFGFSLTSFSVVENAGPLSGSITLTTAGQIDQEIQVVIQTVASGSATASVDYTPTVTTVTFPRFTGGGNTQDFTIPIVDELIVEGTETFILSATIVNDLGNFTAGGDTATGVIIDNDQLDIGYEFGTYDVIEGNVLQEVCLVALNGAQLQVSADVTVSTSNIGQALSGQDYDATSTTVTFTPGSSRECWSIMILDDANDEATECFQVNSVTQSGSINIPAAGSTAMVCIADNDVLDFAFSQSLYNVGEGDAFAQVCIDLTAGVLQRSVPIVLTTSDGSALSGVPDYTATTATISFSSGTAPGGTGSQMCINIPISDDILVENLENFLVSASSTDSEAMFPTGSSASVQITDNDIPMFQFTQTTYAVGEGVGNAMIAIELIDRELTFPIVVSVFDVAGGSATDGADYTGVAASLNFLAGNGPGTIMSFVFPIIDDPNVEPTETILLEANAGFPGQFSVGGDSAVVAITDNDACEVGLEQPVYTVGEANVMQEVCLIKTNNAVLSENIDVQVFTSTLAANGVKGSATAGVDYNSLPGGTTVTFGPGINRACVMIQILEDTDDEVNEFFQVNAQSTNSQLIVSSTANDAQVCITDDDFVMFMLTQSVYNVDEGDGTAEVCVELTSGSASRSITINLGTSDISAVDTMDYTMGGYSVTFQPNAAAGTQVCTPIPITDDTDVELSESFLVSASSTDSQVLFPGGSSSSVSIADNDIPMFRFSQLVYPTAEENGPVTVTVELFDRMLTFPIAVTVMDIAGGSATDGVDYNGVFSVLNFNAGDGPGTTMTFTIPITNDNIDEILENILLQGSAAAPGAFPQNSAQVQINDDDVCEVGIEMNTYDVIESTGMVEICLAKLNNVQLSGPVDVLISTSAAPATAGKNSAIAGTDYTIQNSVAVTFMPGTARQCITIPINDDSLDELTENFMVNAVSSNSASIAVTDSSAEVCIQDDDLIRFAFEMSVYTNEEGQPAVQVCVNLVEGTLTRDVTVDVDNVIGQGTATLNMDYVVVNEALLFPSGSSSGPPPSQQCFFIQPIDDFNVEATEFYQLSATSPDPQAEFSPGADSARVDIIDNDLLPIRIVPAPGLGIPDFTIPEANGSQQVCVEIQNPFGQDHLEKSVVVTLSSADSTAMSPADYSAISMQFIFTPTNQNDQLCVNIPIINDVICEGDEVFTVSLTSNDDCVSIQMPSQGSVTIVDDDVATVGPDQGVVHYNVTERLDDSVWIPIRLSGQKGAGRQCEVEVRTMDGTASAGMDYTSMTTTLTFDNANELQTFHVEILDDTICEGHESFSVFLSSSSEGCEITESELIVWIWDDELHFGDDPHFSIALPGGKLLCYTVQGEHGFSFNLINNEMIVMNSKFVPDARRSEVTWLGSMGIIVQDSQYKGSNSTKLRFESSEKKIYIDDKVSLEAKNIEKLTFSNGKLTISEAPPATGFRYPSVMVDLQDVEISFTIKFTNQHLDMYWHSTGKKIIDSHGLIGQFFRDGVEIDEVRKILIMPSKEPVPVMRRPVWAFMEREDKDDQLCWTAMNPGYQGEGLIDGSYFDYLVDDVMSTDFKFNKQ